MRFPKIIRRDDYDRMIQRAERLEDGAIRANRAAANAGHRRDDAIREAAQIAQDLRLIRIGLDANHSHQKITACIELADEVLRDGFCRQGMLRDMLSYAIERALLEDVPSRSRLLS
jgi:cephalosporin hydroxylase